MIALAYLFVLQSLLAPAATLAATLAPMPAGAAMPLCDDTSVAVAQAERADGRQAGRHEHGSCCDVGCLPYAGGLTLLALPPPGAATLPLPPDCRREEQLAWFRHAPTAARQPGWPGARAPPPSVA